MAVATTAVSTEAKKPIVNFPTVQPNQPIPLLPNAVQQPVRQQPAVMPQIQQAGAATGAGQVFQPNLSKQVVETAQQKAIQGTPSQTASLVSQNAQNLLKDPSMGKDYDAQKKLSMDQLAKQQSSDLEKLRQSTGGTANLGFNIGNLASAQLQQRQEKTNLSQQMDIDAQQQKLSDGLAALTAGQQTVGMEQSLQSGDIDNLIKTSDGALSFAELASKENMFTSQQEWDTTESQLQKDFEMAMTQGDYAQANKLAALMNDFETAKLKNQQEWQSAENIAQNAFKKGMVMNEQEYDKAKQYLAFELEQAAADNDFEKHQYLMDKQQELDLQNMLQSFDFNSKMAVLDSELQTAINNNDFEHQAILNKFTHGLQMQQIEQEQGFEESMKYLDNELELALQTGDYENAKMLNQMKYDQEMSIHLDNMELANMKLDMEQQGLDMAMVESEYEKLQAEIAAGRVDPSASVDYLEQVFADSLPEGFEFTEPDPYAVQAALKDDYLNKMYQYGLTQGEDAMVFETVTNPDGTTTEAFAGLNDSYLGSFNDYVNDTTYAQTGTPDEAEIIALKAGDMPIDQMESKHFDYLLNDVTTPEIDLGIYQDYATQEVGSGSSSRTIYPELENNVGGFTNIGGVLFNVQSKSILDEGGDDVTVYNIVDVVTGQTIEIAAVESGSTSADLNSHGNNELHTYLETIKKDPYYASKGE